MDARTGGPDGGGRRRPPRAAGERHGSPGDAELVAALRRDERWAFRELWLRYHAPLTAFARRAAPSSGTADDCATEVLEDAAMRLMLETTPVPRSLAAYLFAALRHRLVDLHRARERRGEASGGDGSLGGHDVTPPDAADSGCSEATARASRGPGWEPPALPPALARLAARLDAELSDDERLLLGCVARYVPYRQIAEWQGVRYDALAKRVARLRGRLRDAALHHAGAMSAEDQRVVRRFLARAAAPPPEGAPGAPGHAPGARRSATRGPDHE